MHAFVIGGRDLVLGFQLVGVKGRVVSSVDEAWNVLLRAMKDVEVGVILISEEFSTKMRDKIDELRLSRTFPLILEVPERLAPSKAVDLADLIRKAIGIRM